MLNTRVITRAAGWLLCSLALPLFSAGIPIFNTEKGTNGPMPVAEVLAKTKLPPGFHLSLFAAEPDVQQPIAMTTDSKGRLWVAENYTYSERATGYHEQLRDRIVVFEDTDNDGHFDKRTVFWDDAQRLTSIEIGMGGVWVLALPNLYFIPDKDGDGVADGPPQIVLDGFEYNVGRHTVANGLKWGPDGWLYARHGIQSTSKIGAPGTPAAQRTSMNVGIWRYHPTRHVTEVVAQGTTNPWGMDWDEHGELFFINTVIGHLWHVIPGAHYRRMYGDDPTPHIYDVIEQTADHVHWATGETWTDVRKGVSDLTQAAGGGHAHTGLLIYQGGQWPDDWKNKLFTVNFHGRKTNVERLERQGSGFVARHQTDAFQFADPWFRGIDIIPTPDGGIYISDWSDTGECHDENAIHRTSGRIYKITYGEANPGPIKDLKTYSDLELAKLQTSPNNWNARQSRRLLGDRSVSNTLANESLESLRTLAKNGTNDVLRLRALWTLQTIGVIDSTTLDGFTKGTEYERAWALRLMEDRSHLNASEAAKFSSFVKNELPKWSREDPSALVRVTIASLLQKIPEAQRPPIARGLLAHAEDAQDHNLPQEIWYGIEALSTNSNEFVNLVAKASIPHVQRLGARRLAEEISVAPHWVNGLMLASADASSASRQAILDGVADGCVGRRKVTKPAAWDDLQTKLSVGANETLLARIRDLNALFGDGRAINQIRDLALDGKADMAKRKAALQSLIDAKPDDLRAVCERLISIKDLTVTAANGLALFDAPEIGDRLLAEWNKVNTQDRPAIMNVLLTRPAWATKVLSTMAEGRIKRQEVGVAQARAIRNFKNSDLTKKLTEVWGILQDPDEATRQQALRRWQQKITPEALKVANKAEGRKLFTASCATCHKLYGEGAIIGPDLTGTGRQNREYLLENILFPSAIVGADYRQTTLTMKDGRMLSGIVKSRTHAAITLNMVGQATTVSRDEIVSEEISQLSMMPEGLIDGLNDTQVVNLFAYLMSTTPGE